MLANRLGKIPKFAILMYHDVYLPYIPDLLSEYMHPSFRLPQKKFLEQMLFLKEQRYQIVVLNELVNMLVCDELNKKTVVITFDDGLSSNYNVVFPILKEFGFKANFFITVNKIGSVDYMNLEEIKELSRAGMGVYSHTLNHHLMSELQMIDMEKEISLSKKILEEELQKKVDFISFPDGSYNSKALGLVKNASYIGACNSDTGYFNLKTDKFRIPRITVKSNYDLTEFKKIVTGDSLFVMKLKGEFLIKRIIEKIIGKKLYKIIFIFFLKRSLENK